MSLFPDLSELDAAIHRFEAQPGAVAGVLASCQLKAADGTAAAAVAAVPGRTLPPVDVDDNISSFTDLPALDDLVGGVSGGDHDSRRHRTFRTMCRLRRGAFVHGVVVAVRRSAVEVQVRQALVARGGGDGGDGGAVRVMTLDADLDVRAMISFGDMPAVEHLPTDIRCGDHLAGVVVSADLQTELLFVSCLDHDVSRAGTCVLDTRRRRPDVGSDGDSAAQGTDTGAGAGAGADAGSSVAPESSAVGGRAAGGECAEARASSMPTSGIARSRSPSPSPSAPAPAAAPIKRRGKRRTSALSSSLKLGLRTAAPVWLETEFSFDNVQFQASQPPTSEKLPHSLPPVHSTTDSDADDSDGDPFAPTGAVLSEKGLRRYNRMLERSRAFRNPAAFRAMCAMYGLADTAGWKTDTASVGRDFRTLEYEQRVIAADEFVLQGVAMAKQGQHQRAVKEYNKALKAIPGHVDATVALGAAFANTGALSAAVQQFRTALRADPHHANAAEYLQATQARLHREQARSTAPRTLDRAPNGKWTATATPSAVAAPPGAAADGRSSKLISRVESARLEALLKSGGVPAAAAEDNASALRKDSKKRHKHKGKHKKHKSSKRHKSKHRKRSRKHRDSDSDSDSDSASPVAAAAAAASAHPVLSRKRHSLWN